MTTLRSIVALSLALAAPWPASAADAPQRVPVAFPPARTQLTLIPGSNANAAFSEHQPPGIDAQSPAEQALRHDCANGESQRGEATKGFLLSFALQSWRVLLHPLAVAVQEELHKYAQVSAASASGDYYRGGDTSSAAPLAGRISCVRFTRFGATDSTADQVVLDFVASVRLDAQRDAIRLRPLRLFISQGGAKSTDGHYSVAIAVKADAVWRDEFAGHQGQVFEQTVATESVDLKSGSFTKYYPTDLESGTRVPIVPVSFGVDRGRDFGRAEFRVSVAELGTAPETLKLLADMLPDPNENLTKLLIAAAAAGAGLP
ncbi:MAG TPA: hypothetical protein VNX02_07090 [Steroidobacteraceae bacterium]|jgi:hypothetical protein|nr:hypothetical protein [Steroidobacteraceae bacterium]